jgi:hypothetical protein
MLTVADVRLYAKDDAAMNVLLEGNYQSSDELIQLAMKLAVNDFNVVPPISQYAVDNFPSDTVLLYGVMHHLANSEAERQLRNNVTYNAQGLNAGIDDKFPQYNQLSQYYKGLFEAKIRELKTQQNLEQAWGGSFSPYAGLNEWKFRGA